MSVKKYNEDFVLSACGLINTGVICYLNSFLQSLMSCTSITEFFLNNEYRFLKNDNKVALEYIKLIKKVRDSNSIDVFESSSILQEIVKITKKKYPSKTFGSGQEDSGEGLHLFLDTIDDKELYGFFMYRYNVKTWCLSCKKTVSERRDESCVLEVPQQFSGLFTSKKNDTQITDPLNRHILQYMSILDYYNCPECKNTKCCKIYQLAFVPEIVTVMFNKYDNKKNVEFPENLCFPSTGTSTLKYKIMAKIEHSGGRNGGHYWSNCYRKEDGVKKIFKLNDRSVSVGNFKPTKETYIVFYHNV